MLGCDADVGAAAVEEEPHMWNHSLRVLSFGALAPCVVAFGSAARANAAGDVVFKIYNDTSVAITEIYNKDSRQSNWGWNDLQGVGSANPLEGKVTPVQPGHSFYIRFKQNSYAHCPEMTQDLKVVFANKAVKVLDKVPVCNVDVHLHKP